MNSSNDSNSALGGRARRMPLPGCREAPFFNKEKPNELITFLSILEDLFKEYGLTSDQDKKDKAGRYTDASTTEEWKALDTYQESSTWVEYWAELVESYPEAANLKTGSLARLNQICREHKRLAPGDLADLLAFKHAFQTEAKKLQRPPSL
ncbi:hypothetical protein M413DRAFT_63314, partial [Hebeloma cylindrosporum]